MPPSVSQATGTARAPHRVSRFKLVVCGKDRYAGGNGQNWYRSVPKNGRATVTPQRRGSLKDVTAHCAEQGLNNFTKAAA